ncbi:MAG: hypothetical protein EOO65_00780, partial [Methanosarcinales archaeon]
MVSAASRAGALWCLLLVLIVHHTAWAARDVAMSSLIAGGYTGTGLPATTARLLQPNDACEDPDTGDVYIAEATGQRVRVVNASTGILTHVAGTGYAGFGGDGGLAILATLNNPRSLAWNPTAQLLYIGDSSNFRVRAVHRNGTIFTVVGTGLASSTGDGGRGTLAAIRSVLCLLWVDSRQELYIVDGGSHKVRMLNASGYIFTFAGTGSGSYSGEHVLATMAAVKAPAWAAYSRAQDGIFVADTGNERIRFVNASGFISTIAGTGTGVVAPDDSDALTSTVHSPLFLCVRADGTLAFSERNRNQLRVITSDGLLLTLASSLSSLNGGFCRADGSVVLALGGPHLVLAYDDSGAATPVAGTSSGTSTSSTTNVILYNPVAVDLFPSGDLVISDMSNHVLRSISAMGEVRIIAGGPLGQFGFSGDGGPAAAARIRSPSSVAYSSSSGSWLIADGGNARVRLVNDATRVIQTVPIPNSIINSPSDVLFLPDGRAAIAVSVKHVIVGLFPNGTWYVMGGIVDAKNFTGDGGPLALAQFHYPTSLAVSYQEDGWFFIVDLSNYRVRHVRWNDTVVSTVFGKGTAAFTADGAVAQTSSAHAPIGVVQSRYTKDIFVIERDARRVRVIYPSGLLGTLAGTGAFACAGVFGPALSTPLAQPRGADLDQEAGILYVVDYAGAQIRAITLAGIDVHVGNASATDTGCRANRSCASFEQAFRWHARFAVTFVVVANVTISQPVTFPSNCIDCTLSCLPDAWLIVQASPNLTSAHAVFLADHALSMAHVAVDCSGCAAASLGAPHTLFDMQLSQSSLGATVGRSRALTIDQLFIFALPAASRVLRVAGDARAQLELSLTNTTVMLTSDTVSASLANASDDLVCGGMFQVSNCSRVSVNGLVVAAATQATHAQYPRSLLHASHVTATLAISNIAVSNLTFPIANASDMVSANARMLCPHSAMARIDASASLVSLTNVAAASLQQVRVSRCNLVRMLFALQTTSIQMEDTWLGVSSLLQLVHAVDVDAVHALRTHLADCTTSVSALYLPFSTRLCSELADDAYSGNIPEAAVLGELAVPSTLCTVPLLGAHRTRVLHVQDIVVHGMQPEPGPASMHTLIGATRVDNVSASFLTLQHVRMLHVLYAANSSAASLRTADIY